MTTATPTKFKKTEIGLIPEEWDVFFAEDYCDRVADGTHDSPKQVLDGKYLITSKHLKNNRIDFSSAYHISEEDFKNIIKRSGVSYGNVLFSMIGTVGEVCLVSSVVIDFAIKNIGLFKSKSFDSGKWLYYFLKSSQAKEYLESHLAGSTQQYLTLETLRKYPIVVPPVAEQKEIAEILSSLDDKIELNRKINANLEKLASSLFKKWFVDIEDELPEGWRIGTFGEAVENFDSKRIPLSSMERKPGSYPYYGATSIMDYVEDYIFDGTYVLLGEDGSVAKEDGKPFVQYVHGKMWVNNHAHVLQGKNGFSTEYIKVFLDQVDIMPFVTGAVQPKLNQANMNSVPMVIPDQKTLGRFNEILTALFRMILENESQTKNIEQVRDSLLPRLMSGKIRVKI